MGTHGPNAPPSSSEGIAVAIAADVGASLCDCITDACICPASAICCLWPCLIGQIGAVSRRWPLGAPSLGWSIAFTSFLLLLFLVLSFSDFYVEEDGDKTLDRFIDIIWLVPTLGIVATVYHSRMQARDFLGQQP